VLTFGCVIREDPAVATYDQYLGKIDWLGLLNSTGGLAEHRPIAHHSTNTTIPLSLAVAQRELLDPPYE
jgi:hypothetical protein